MQSVIIIDGRNRLFMKKLKRKYYEYRIRRAQDNIDLVKGLHGATEKQLSDNIVYIRSRAAIEYYTVLLSVYQY